MEQININDLTDKNEAAYLLVQQQRELARIQQNVTLLDDRLRRLEEQEALKLQEPTKEG